MDGFGMDLNEPDKPVLVLTWGVSTDLHCLLKGSKHQMHGFDAGEEPRPRCVHHFSAGIHR
jgi:hypothetical protein